MGRKSPIATACPLHSAIAASYGLPPVLYPPAPSGRSTDCQSPGAMLVLPLPAFLWRSTCVPKSAETVYPVPVLPVVGAVYTSGGGAICTCPLFLPPEL